MFFWRILRTLGCLIGVSGEKALFQSLPSWDQFPTAALLSEVLILIIILIIIINRYCHHTASCLDQVLGQRMVESIRAFLDCFPPPTSQCMCSKVSQSNNINMAKRTKHQQHQKKHRRHYDKRTKKQNPKTPTQQKSQKQKVSSYNCKAKKQQQLAHEQRKTT